MLVSSMLKLNITNGRFTFEGENFVIDMSARDRRKSDSEAYTLVKSQAYFDIFEAISQTILPRSMLELGIFQGGSYVFLDKLFKPKRMAGVEIVEDPVHPLMDYISRTPSRFAYFGVSQSDEARLRQIVSDDLAGELDLVVDDASHSYEHTKRSFEILFPLLQPRGIYVIEDWAWAHHPAYQSKDSPFASRTALTSLLFEQIVLLGSTGDIDKIRISKPLYLIRKSSTGRTGHPDVWSGIRTRGRGLHSI